ncbi:MFS transporter [Williamsia sp. 1135]|uniref:MFS transporter n=1 Tax=Williamsia sp. 1135 TaxID=1889262 RepID=UPI0023E46942|nr:MFS transporter [Williamsia sp. 1135]
MGSRRWAPLWVASSAQLMLVLDVSVINVALPKIEDDLGMGAESVQWVASAYVLAFASALLVGGRFADVFGLRRVLLGGLLIFVAASVVGGLAHTGAAVIAARGVQGIGAAIASRDLHRAHPALSGRAAANKGSRSVDRNQPGRCRCGQHPERTAH